MKLTKEERAELEARLAEDDAADDGDDEVEISFNGQSFRGAFRRAQSVAKAWGFKLEPDPEPPADEGSGKGGKGGGGEVKRFAGRRVS